MVGRSSEASASPSGIDDRLREVMERMANATETGTVSALLKAQHMAPAGANADITGT